MLPVLLCVTHSLKAQAHGNEVTLIFFGRVGVSADAATSVTAEQVSRFPAVSALAAQPRPPASRLPGGSVLAPPPHPLLAGRGHTEAPWCRPPNPQTHSCTCQDMPRGRSVRAAGPGPPTLFPDVP